MTKNLTALGTEATFKEYTDLFVQRDPRFILKTKPGKKWRTVRRRNGGYVKLGDKYIQGHLAGQHAVGALGRWYPIHAFLDIDKRDIETVQDIRSAAELTESNSMLCSSESPDSYHLIFRPTYHNKPLTVKLLNEILQPFAEQHAIEIYPRARKCARLPFGKIQQCLDEGMELIDGWEQKTYWFQKLDEFDLAGVKGHQQLSFEPMLKAGKPGGVKLSTFDGGQELFEHGLQRPSSRHESQFQVLYYLWRKNIPLDEAERVTWKWIKKKHNGFSQDIVSSPQTVRGEIQRQASWVWEHYLPIYPDSTHNTYQGYVTKADVVNVLKVSSGSLPRARFLCHLVKYFHPRRNRNRVNIHSDLLQAWSSKDTYINRIGELEKKGIVYRGEGYLSEVRSKQIRMKWDFRSLDDAVLVDDRAPDTLGDTIRAAFTEEDARALLRVSGMHDRTASDYAREIFHSHRSE